MRRPPLKETDLYEPVAVFVRKRGYQVYAEVEGCDVVGVRGDELLVVELKRRLDMTLLIQATQRQRLTPTVYVAVPHPAGLIRTRRWTRICHLLRRLELGLLLVRHDRPQSSRAGRGGAGRPLIEEAFSPGPLRRQMSHQRPKRLITELVGRTVNLNTGGSSATPLVTAYREGCLRIVAVLDALGPQSPSALRRHGTGEKTQSILQANHYGWYVHLDRAVWGLSDRGREATRTYSELIKSWEVVRAPDD